MNKSNQSLLTLGRLSVGVGLMLLVFALWGNWSDAKQIADEMANIIIAISAIGSGLALIMKENKQE